MTSDGWSWKANLPSSVPAHLDRQWGTAAWVIWNALDEDDSAYGIAAAVVEALDRAGHFRTPAALVFGDAGAHDATSDQVGQP